MVLDKDVLDEVKEVFDRDLKGEVKLLFVKGKELNPCEYCQYIEELLSELESVSSGKLKVEIADGDENRSILEERGLKTYPVIEVIGKNKGKIRFYGIPSGHEFGAFIKAITTASTGETDDITEEVKEMVLKVDFPVNIEVFVTPSCPYCPLMAATAYAFALYNENFTSDVVEVIEHSEWADRYRVQSVPKTVINGKLDLVGAYPPDVILNKILHLGGNHNHEH